MKIMKNIFISGAFGATIKSCSDGIYRHPEDCSAFYQCANGHRYEDQYCPNGLLFNELTSQCDWSKNVDCGECTDGVHPHETDCTAYYQCSHGHRYPDQFCADGLLFDKDLLVCNWAENVECNFQSTTDPSTTDTTAAGNVTGAGMTFCEDGIYRGTACNEFYQCWNGMQFPTQHCPEGLLFNTELLTCDWAENVECENETTTVIDPTTAPEGNYTTVEMTTIDDGNSTFIFV